NAPAFHSSQAIPPRMTMRQKIPTMRLTIEALPHAVNRSAPTTGLDSHAPGLAGLSKLEIHRSDAGSEVFRRAGFIARSIRSSGYLRTGVRAIAASRKRPAILSQRLTSKPRPPNL